MDASTSIRLRSGNSMPILGLGTWELTRDTPGTVAHAFELGYRLVDTACDYGSQPGIGEAIRRGVIDRNSLYLVAKVEETDDAYAATRKYLSEIGVEYADLMLIHRPPDEGVGVELWQGLVQARDQGLTNDIGVSNYTIEQMEELEQQVGEIPVVNQIEWTPFGHSKEMRKFCREREIVIQAYSPLTRAERLGDEALNEIAHRYGKTPAQILIRWDIQLGTVPLPKANRREHLQENIDVFDFELSAEDMQRLDQLNEQYSALGSLPYV